MSNISSQTFPAAPSLVGPQHEPNVTPFLPHPPLAAELYGASVVLDLLCSLLLTFRTYFSAAAAAAAAAILSVSDVSGEKIS